MGEIKILILMIVCKGYGWDIAIKQGAYPGGLIAEITAFIILFFFTWKTVGITIIIFYRTGGQFIEITTGNKNFALVVELI